MSSIKRRVKHFGAINLERAAEQLFKAAITEDHESIINNYPSMIEAVIEFRRHTEKMLSEVPNLSKSSKQFTEDRDPTSTEVAEGYRIMLSTPYQ